MKKNPFIDPLYPFHLQKEPQAQKQIATDFIGLDINQYNQLLIARPEEYWQEIGLQKALNLFHLAAQYIPAYKDFLKKNNFNHTTIKTPQDFLKVPVVNKKNYISQYPLESLCWNGDVTTSNIISFSSGSTGDPYYWPRDTYQTFEGGFFLEHYLTSFFEIHKKSTLFVDCYSMGSYVAGTHTFSSAQLIANKGYSMTVITPGINYQDTFRMLKALKSKYDQVILSGYPPFIKDIIDMGPSQGLDWQSFPVRLFVSSDFFSEVWRDNILQTIGSKQPLIDSTNLYGAADATIFGLETPSTTVIRKITSSNYGLNHALYDSNLTPTLVQYNPALRYFETIDEELYLTSATGIPLIRYGLKDRGSIFTSKELNQKLTALNTTLEQELAKHSLQHTHQNLPFLFITNRTDGAVSYYAIKIYPEFIGTGVQDLSLKDKLSGKFSAVSTYNKKGEQKLVIHVELNQGVEKSKELTTLVEQAVAKSLLTRCVEYAFLKKSLGKRALPKVILHPKGHSDYFKIAIKQKWIAQ